MLVVVEVLGVGVEGMRVGESLHEVVCNSAGAYRWLVSFQDQGKSEER